MTKSRKILLVLGIALTCALPISAATTVANADVGVGVHVGPVGVGAHLGGHRHCYWRHHHRHCR